MLKREDFDNDKKDAGELGSGHTVTAIYEIIPNKPRTKTYARELIYPSTRAAAFSLITAGKKPFTKKCAFYSLGCIVSNWKSNLARSVCHTQRHHTWWFF